MMDDDTGTIRVDVQADTRPLAAALGDLKGLADDFGRAMTSAFRQSAFEGKRLDDVLRELALGLSEKALGAALAPVERGLAGGFGAILGGLSNLPGFARGGLFRDGAAMPVTQGGAIAAPTYLPLHGGPALMGEAGPEAVLPLARGSDGRLGVRAAGGARNVNVTFNVSTPDAGSFRRGEAELTAMLARAVARGSRGL